MDTREFMRYETDGKSFDYISTQVHLAFLTNYKYISFAVRVYACGSFINPYWPVMEEN